MAVKRGTGELTAQQLSSLIARFAHDAASPLMIVLSATEELAAQPGLSESQRADLEEIRNAGAELHELIKKLHQVSTEW